MTSYDDHLDGMIPAVRAEHERHIAGMTPEERGRYYDHVYSLNDDDLQRYMAGQHSNALRRLDQQAIDLDRRMGVGPVLDGDVDGPAAPEWQPIGGVGRWSADISEEQIGDYYDVTYQDPTRRAQVTASWYVVQRGDKYQIKQETERLIAGDLAQPGATEEWADYDYADVDGSYSTAEEAQQAAHDLAQQHRSSDISWNGQPPWAPSSAASSASSSASGGAGAPAPEVTGLGSAIAYAEQMSVWFLRNAISTEQWIASLQSQGGVSGAAITAAQQAVESQHQAAAAWAACTVVLDRHKQVGEAYQSNPGAGTREFNTHD